MIGRQFRVTKKTNETTNARRRNLQRLIDDRYEGKQANLLSDFYVRTGRDLNQGELSGLVGGTKSFGEKKARSLEASLSLPPGSLDKEPQSGLEGSPIEAMLEALRLRVAAEGDFRILLQVILDENPPEVPDHIRESIKSMVHALRNLIRQSALREKND